MWLAAAGAAAPPQPPPTVAAGALAVACRPTVPDAATWVAAAAPAPHGPSIGLVAGLGSAEAEYRATAQGGAVPWDLQGAPAAEC